MRCSSIPRADEKMVVIQDERHFRVGDDLCVLRIGGCITIDRAIPRWAGNRSPHPAIDIAAITPPSF
jgi:hypothetical protein